MHELVIEETTLAGLSLIRPPTIFEDYRGLYIESYNKKIYAIKPLTFMNNSGICIRELIEYFKIDPEDVIVFHDDLDINFGKIKTKFGGSSAGHNGIESIDKFIGKDYARVRIGIGKPNGKINTADHVLKDFDEEEKLELKNITSNITDSLTILLDKKLELFSSTVNNK